MTATHNRSGGPGPARGRPPGFGRRLAAVGLDYLVILIWVGVVTALGVAGRALAPGLGQALFSHPLAGELVGFGLLTLPVALYFVLSEASPSGATWGKRRIGLRVVTLDGRRIGPWRSSVRTAVKLLPWEVAHFAVWQLSAGPTVPDPIPYLALGVVWAIVGASLATALVTRRRRGAHDLVAGTMVLETG